MRAAVGGPSEHLGVQVIQNLPNKHLGLGARDEHAGLAKNVDHTKTRGPRYVLDRLALRATHHGIMHARQLVLIEGAIEIHVQLDTAHPRHRCEEQLRRVTRTLVALLLEVSPRPIEAPANCPHFVRHGPALTFPYHRML